MRYLPLTRVDESPRVWEELPLSRTLGTKQTTQGWHVGIDSVSFSQLYAQWLECRHLTDGQRNLLPDTLAAWPKVPKIDPVIID